MGDVRGVRRRCVLGRYLSPGHKQCITNYDVAWRPIKRKMHAKQPSQQRNTERNMATFMPEIQSFKRDFLIFYPPHISAAFLGWSMWGDWGQCSKPCSSGMQGRMRVCIASSPFIASVCDSACNGTSIETRECNTHKCPGTSPAVICSI